MENQILQYDHLNSARRNLMTVQVRQDAAKERLTSRLWWDWEGS
jgi:hypothetical protein